MPRDTSQVQLNPRFSSTPCRGWPESHFRLWQCPSATCGAALQISQHRLTGAAMIHLDSEPIEAYTFRNGVLRSSTPIAWKAPTGQTVEVSHPWGCVNCCQLHLSGPATADPLQDCPLTVGCAAGRCPVPPELLLAAPQPGASTGSPHIDVLNPSRANSFPCMPAYSPSGLCRTLHSFPALARHSCQWARIAKFNALRPPP